MQRYLHTITSTSSKNRVIYLNIHRYYNMPKSKNSGCKYLNQYFKYTACVLGQKTFIIVIYLVLDV